MTHYDYGFRIYNPGIGKFLSVDPLTQSYPMLTPYQFASNTPIQAIDLDGLEAMAIHFDVRASAFLTISNSQGIIIDLKNNVGFFNTTGFGLGLVAGASYGGGITVFPGAETIYDTKGDGFSLFATGAYGGKFGGSLDFAFVEKKGRNIDLDVGVTLSAGAGLEAGVGVELTDTKITGTTWGEIGDFFAALAPDTKEEIITNLETYRKETESLIFNLNEQISEEIGRFGREENKELEKLESEVNVQTQILKNVTSTLDRLKTK